MTRPCLKKVLENHLILNQIHDILTELQNQGKQLTLCKVPAYMGIKGNEESDRGAKQAIDISGIIIKRVCHIDS